MTERDVLALLASLGVDSDIHAFVQIANHAALSVFGRSANSVGDGADIAAGTDAHVMRRSGTSIGFGTIGAGSLAAAAGAAILRADQGTGVWSYKAISTNTILARLGTGSDLEDVSILTNTVLLRRGGNLEALSCPASQWLGRKATGDLDFWGAIAVWLDILGAGGYSGTSFPAHLDGRPFYRTDLKCLFVSNGAHWLSVEVHEFYFSASADVSTSIYLAMGMSGSTQFADTRGPRFGFDVKVVGMSLQMDASDTCAVDVWDDGAVVSDSTAQLSLSSQQGKDDDTLLSTTIAAGSIIGVKRTSGTIQGPFLGCVRLRRVAT